VSDSRGAPVCVVGSLHFDIMVRAPYLPRTGETLMGDSWWWKPGGKGGNQAMAASRHGASVRMVGSLGVDDFGVRLRECLAAARVDLAHVAAADRGSGMSVAIQQAGGDYAAIVVAGADDDLDVAHVTDSASAIRDSRVLLIQNEIAAASNVAAARIARAAGTMVILNAAPARPMGELAGLVDVLVVNTVEAEMLGSGVVEDLASAATAAEQLRSADDAATAAEALPSADDAATAAGGLRSADAVIVTAGAAGVAAATREGSWSIPGHAVTMAETHGAGDVFVGALAARLAEAVSLQEALRYANAAAALHVGTPAANRAYIGPSDVRRLLEAARADQLGDRSR
jgi:ribokinase